VRDLFVSYLTGPSIRPLALEARLVSQAVEEARQHACDRLLVVTLTRKHHGGGLMGRALGRAADTASWGIPARGVAGAVARGTTAGVAEAVSALAASTRANDELELHYELRPLEGSSIVTKTNKARAHDDQEDLLTPLVEQAATAIAAALGEPL
jgi:hypothetical protein